MLNKSAERVIGSLITQDDILTYEEIDKVLTVPGFIKEDATLAHNINFFIKRPGGYYILLFVLIFHFKKIICTIEMLHHYIPHSICSKATLSNVINEALRKKILIKEDCRKDKRVKKIIPSQILIEEWSKLKSAVLNDLDNK